MRARELGIEIGSGRPGPLNAITDVAGVRVGHVTLIEGDDVRTGVTVVVPHEGDPGLDPVFAGCHRLNGNGELAGLEWVRESGLLTTPIGLTNTHSVGVVRDGLIAARGGDRLGRWSLPVVGETYDGFLNDIDGMHVRAEHAAEALASASTGPVAEGNAGGGTGMTCHGFKGGIGTSSRVVEDGWTVGVLVQANYGARERFRVNGLPVGVTPPVSDIPTRQEGAGSIIGIVATDAPLLPCQCDRLAQRAGLGVARTGGAGETSSGDIFFAFATGNRGLEPAKNGETPPPTVDLRMVPDGRLNPLFYAVIDATEEAILNALLAAETMTGRNGNTAYALDPDALKEAISRVR